MALQAQWSLDATTTSVASFSQDLVRAMTTDNVQPLALLACERFGATLAISPDTCRRIERSVLPPCETRAVKFLKSVAGYSRHDSVTFLGRSLAGVQFLALAAALETSMDSFNAATAIYSMMRATATDSSSIPPLGQVHNLLKAIDHRLVLAGFCNQIVGWELALSGHRGLHTSTRSTRPRRRIPTCSRLPTAEAIEGLVGALRELARIGEATISSITICARDCAPWVVAFLTWCLGKPPALVFQGIPFAEDTGALVTVRLEEGIVAELSITLHHTIKRPEQLIYREENQEWRGMVSIETYGKGMLRIMGFEDPEVLAVIKECMPYLVKQSLDGAESYDPGASHPASSIPATMSWKRLSPFSSHHQVERVLSKILGVNLVSFSEMVPGQKIYKLPETAKYLGDHRCVQACLICIPGSVTQRNRREYGVCKVNALYLNLGYILKRVLAISLLHSPTDASLLFWQKEMFDRHNDEPFFVNLIRACLGNMEYRNPHLPADYLFETALDLAGASKYTSRVRVFDLKHRWLMSAHRGQVIYPSIFDHFNIESDGYLELYCVPGRLQFEKTDYSIAVSTDHPPIGINMREVKSPANIRQMHITWRVHAEEDCLVASLQLAAHGVSSCGLMNPKKCLLALSQAVKSENCGHPKSAGLSEKYTRLSHVSPLERRGEDTDVIYDVSDNPIDARFFALGNRRTNDRVDVTTLIRTRTCLACCLDFLDSKTGLREII